jgi:aminoglycoside phosphotransferase (APT) family kinase protein
MTVSGAKPQSIPPLGAPNGAFVIKFFSHLQKLRTQDTEIAAHMMFSFLARGKELVLSAVAPQESAEFVHAHTPSIITHGRLYDLKRSDIRDVAHVAEENGWPYIIMPFIHGQDLLETFPKETVSPTLSEFDESAVFLGKYLRHLHQFEVPLATKPNVNPLYNNGWRGFEKWLVKQRRVITRGRPIDPESLPPCLFYAIDDYLPRDVRDLVDWYKDHHNLERPRLLHNDLNEEHLFLLDKKPYAVIDFGDCRLGDPQYDWVAVFISAFRCNKRLLIKALYEYYQIDSFEILAEKVGGWKRFTYTMMSYSLLHEQDAMRSAYNRRPELREIKDMYILADQLWNLSIPDPEPKPSSQI